MMGSSSTADFGRTYTLKRVRGCEFTGISRRHGGRGQRLVDTGVCANLNVEDKKINLKGNPQSLVQESDRSPLAF
jgi:hypothetical protein